MHTAELPRRTESLRRWINLGLSALVLIQIAVLAFWDHLPSPWQQTNDAVVITAAHQIDEQVMDEPVLPPQIVDVGYLVPGEVASLDLPFTSPFEGCVSVLSCATTCGCLEVLAHPEYLSPEEGSTVTVQLEVPERIGYYAQRVKIVTDHPVHEIVEVVLNARIGIPLRSEPAELVVEVSDATKGMSAFEIWNDGPDPVKLLYATSEFGRVRVPTEPIEPGAATALMLEWNGDQNPPNEFEITIRTACANQRSISVPVRTR